MGDLLGSLRAAIKSSGQSRYQIAKATGVAESVLSRFMSGERGLSIETAERIAAHLGLEVVLRRRKRKE
jgi:transcriptional regulator with XRE-family HTH domain